MNTAELSVLLVWGAATALTIALVAFAIDLARIEDRAEAQAEARVPAPWARRPRHAPRGRRRRRRRARPPSCRGHRAVDHLRRAPRCSSWRSCCAASPPAARRGPTCTSSRSSARSWRSVFLGDRARRDFTFLGVVVTGLAVLFLVLGLNVFYIAATGVQPALQNYWLVIHVGVAISATGIFTVAFVSRPRCCSFRDSPRAAARRTRPRDARACSGPGSGGSTACRRPPRWRPCRSG